MPASFDVTSGRLEVTFTWDLPLEHGQETLVAAAHRIYNMLYVDPGNNRPDPPAFDDLSNQQKLNLVYDEAGEHIVQQAKAYIRAEAKRLAQEAANLDTDDLVWIDPEE